MKAFILTCVLFATTFAGAAETTNQVLARIALLSDTHTLVMTNQKYAAYSAHLAEAATAANEAKVDLVLIAGNLTESGTKAEMADFQNQIRQFKAPVWFVPGNHDVGNKAGTAKASVVTAERVEAFEKQMGTSFFERRLSGVRIIGVNASLFGSGLSRETEMWTFLERQLAETNDGRTLLLSHYPLFLKSADEPGGQYYNIEPAPRARLLTLLRRGGAAAVLSGHYHRPLVNRSDGILLLTTPPISFGLPAGKQPEGWTLVTVPVSGEIQYEFRDLKH